MEAVTRAQHWSPTQISTTGDKKVNRIIYRTRTAFLNQIAIMCISLFLYHVFHWIQVTDIRVRQTHAESSWGNCYYWCVQRHLLWAARSLFLSLREREADRASGVEQQTHCAATVTTYLSRKWVRWLITECFLIIAVVAMAKCYQRQRCCWCFHMTDCDVFSKYINQSINQRAYLQIIVIQLPVNKNSCKMWIHGCSLEPWISFKVHLQGI